MQIEVLASPKVGIASRAEGAAMVRVISIVAGLLAFTFLFGTVPWAPASVTYYMFGRCFGPSDLIQFRPATVVYGCDSTGIMEKMTWVNWGPDVADGGGTDDSTDCVPSCAQGKRYYNPVVVHAWNPKPAGCRANILFWADFVIAYPQGTPPDLGPRRNGYDSEFIQYDGMPAVHYFNQTARSCGIMG
jgi:hypothetical protein